MFILIIIPLYEVGTNNIISKAQRNKAPQSFQPVKAQLKMRFSTFLISKVQPNFRNKIFDLAKRQRNSAIVEWNFCTKSKRNLTFAIKILEHNANTTFLRFLTEKE